MAVATLLSLPGACFGSLLFFPKNPRNPKPYLQSRISHEFADAICAMSYLFLLFFYNKKFSIFAAQTTRTRFCKSSRLTSALL